MLGIGRYSVGSHRNSQVINFHYIEDDYCSSAELGLAGFAVNELEPCEAQARGFTHGHRKVYGVPEPAGPELLQQFKNASPTTSLTKLLADIGNALVQCASTLQYETATLPAKQMQQAVPVEKFIARQQELSRLDGGLEIDGSNRQNVDPSPEEPLGHIAAEGDKATLENPYEKIANKYKNDEVVEVQILNKNESGAVVKIVENNVEAFLHQNQLSWQKLKKISGDRKLIFFYLSETLIFLLNL